MLGRNILKEVKEKASKIRKKMSDKDFFLSNNFKNYFIEMLTSVAGRFGRNKKIIIEANKGYIAYTDNTEIRINVDNEIVSYFKNLQSKVMCLLGLLFHETAHILFYDFKSSSKAQKTMESGAWFPYAPAVEKKKEIIQEMTEVLKISNGARGIIINIFHKIDNIFADVHDERKICEMFPGLVKKSIQYPQTAMYEMSKTYEDTEKEFKDDSKKDTSSNLAFMLNLVLKQARYDDCKIFTNVGWESEYVATLGLLIDYIETGRETDDMNEKYDCINKCLVILWPYIKPIVDEIKKMEDSLSDSYSSLTKNELDSLMRSIEEELEKSADSTETKMPLGSGSPIESEDKSKKSKSSSKKTGGSEDKEDSDSEDGSEGDSDSKKEEGSKKEKSGSKEKGDSERTDEEKLKEKAKKAVEERKESLSSIPESLEGKVESLKEDVADDIARENIEKDRSNEVNAEIKSIDANSMHSGIRRDFVRKSKVTDEMKEKYNKIAKEILPISKAMQRQIMQALKDRREGGKSYGEICGKKFESKCIPRIDGKYFSKTKLPTETPRICVGVLVDESGSMRGNRVDAAVKAAILFEDFARNCNIPTLICGHSTTGSRTFALFSYVEFDKIDNNDKYRLADIEARSQNRDGLALKLMCERLAKRPEEVKMLIVMSDGQPADYDYGGASAEKEMKEICKEYKRKGVNIFAAAIGSDKENIHRIYGDGFLDITDLTKLPKTMVNLIKKQITF